MEQRRFVDLHFVDFQKFLEIQDEFWEKRANADITDTILLAEHPPTISLGARSDETQLKHLTVSPEWLKEKSIPVVKTKRGGSITVHGPGILGCYVIAHIRHLEFSLRFITRLQAWTKDALETLGVTVTCLPQELRHDKKDMAKYEGLWIKNKKITSVGIQVSRNVTRFGININTNPEEWLMKLVHPCGIEEYEMTSLKKEGFSIDKKELIAALSKSAEYFLK